MYSNNYNIPIDSGYIQSTIHKPPEADIIAVISHEPGSGRFCLRNKQLVSQLDRAGIASLICEWRSARDRTSEFDPFIRAQTLKNIIHWLKNHRDFENLSPVLYGSCIGAASAIIAAAELQDDVISVISKNGKLEIADSYLDKVHSPTFVAVGDKDYRLLELNTKAYRKLVCPKKLVIVPGITPFFEKPKHVEKVERLAIKWIYKHSMYESASAGDRRVLTH